MSAEGDRQSLGQQATVAEAPATSLLDDVISATKQTQPDQTKELLKSFVDEALGGTVSFSRNMLVTLKSAISELDRKMSEQLAVIMHSPDFLTLEGSWRGLKYLVFNSETNENLKVKVMNVSKHDLMRDMTRAVEFDQSTIWGKVYENEFGTPGGEPYGALVGDYEFTNHPDDIDLLRMMSGVAAGSFAPFLTAASPKLFGFEDFRDLPRQRDLAKTFESREFTKWRSFRDSDDSCFVTLTMPRVMARLPYGTRTRPIDEFNFEEAPQTAEGAEIDLQHDHYCWMNSSFVLATKMTEAFSKFGWSSAIRGAEGGGKVEDLPTHTFASLDGDVDLKCPTEISISDRREGELSKLGFLPLCHYKNTDHAVFIGGQTAHKPKLYDRDEATANAAIAARLPYLMITSRFAQYLKVIARDKIGSFMEREDCEAFLNRWIQNYVNANPTAGADSKASHPLRDASVKVTEIPGQPGSYNAVAHLRPWLQFEELNTSMRLVARVPGAGQR